MNHDRMTTMAVFVCLTIVTAPVAGEWLPQPPGILPINHMTRSLHVVDANTIWAVSDTTDPSYYTSTPRVARSTNGGTTWSVSTIPGTVGYLLVDVFALDSGTAWVSAFDLSGTEGGIYKTTDGGASWVQQLPGPWIWLAFFDAMNGVAVTVFSSPFARITTDGGASWQPAPTPPTPAGAFFHAGNNSRAVVGNSIWVVSTSGQIKRSTDRGYHWTTHSVSLPVDKVLSIAFKDANNGLVSTWHGGQNHLARTTDAGETWTALAAPAQPRGYCITDVPQAAGGYVMAAGEEENPFGGGYGGSTYTLDGGATWTPVDDVFHSGVDFLDPLVGWAGGSSSPTTSGLYKWEGTALGIDTQQPASTPLALFLSQNYPNPFNPTTNIGFTLPVSERVQLVIYDVLGREVETLVDAVRPAGPHVVVFDATRLPSGVYFYQLTGMRSVERRSMVIAK